MVPNTAQQSSCDALDLDALDFESPSTPNSCGPTTMANYKIHQYRAIYELHMAYIFAW